MKIRSQLTLEHILPTYEGQKWLTKTTFTEEVEKNATELKEIAFPGSIKYFLMQLSIQKHLVDRQSIQVSLSNWF